MYGRPLAGNNLAANIPGLSGGFQDFHPMKGPMTTQTFQDIIGKEPLHWRGDRDCVRPGWHAGCARRAAC